MHTGTPTNVPATQPAMRVGMLTFVLDDGVDEDDTGLVAAGAGVVTGDVDDVVGAELAEGTLGFDGRGDSFGVTSAGCNEGALSSAAWLKAGVWAHAVIKQHNQIDFISNPPLITAR
jgi:hypothetical protein